MEETEETEETKSKMIFDAIYGVIMILSLGAYLIIGWVSGNWHPYWVIIVIGASLCGILIILSGTFSKIKENKKGRFAMTSEAICRILFLLSVVVYLCLGLSCALWHQHWIIIPITAFVCGIIKIISNTHERLQRAKSNDEPTEKINETKVSDAERTKSVKANVAKKNDEK